MGSQQPGGESPAGAGPERARVRAPLWIKLAVFAALLATAPTLGMGLSLTSLYRDTLQRSSLEYGMLVADDITQTIDLELGLGRSGLVEVARTLSDGEVSGRDREERAAAIVESNPLLDHAAIYDAQGALIDTLRERDARAPEPPPLLSQALRATTAEDRVAPGPLARDASGAWRVPLSQPIVASGRVTGHVMSQVPLQRVLERVSYQAQQRFEGRPDALFVVDGAQQIIAHPDPARVMTQAQEVPFLSQMSASVIARGVARSGAHTRADGARVLAVFKPLREVPWAIVAQIPYEVAFAPLEQLRRAVAIALALALILAVLGALVLARRVTAPLPALMRQAHALSERRFDARVQVRTQDELAVLGGAMSDAAASLERSEAVIRQEQAIRLDLGRYLPRELVERVVSREQDMGLGGRRQEVTVMFADVVGFTPLCERLDPEQTVAILNELFTIMTEIVFRNQGTVDKFLGDCVMAFWNAPQAQPDHAALALQAAEEILSWLELGNAGWQQRYGLTLQLAIGVHTGDAIVGNIGSRTRMEYTVIGDTVNVAARLESIARPMQILTTQATCEAAGSGFDVVALGERELSGQASALMLYEVRV